MSPTEQIAVKLFGWKADKRSRGCTWTRFTCESPMDVAIIYDIGVNNGPDHWPDFTDDRLKWYWIRQVEDALINIKNGHYQTYYLHCLADIWDEESGTQPPTFTWRHLLSTVALRSTAEQRLAAALRVLNDMKQGDI